MSAQYTADLSALLEANRCAYIATLETDLFAALTGSLAAGSLHLSNKFSDIYKQAFKVHRMLWTAKVGIAEK